MGFFEWGAGNGCTTGNGGVFDSNGNQVGTTNHDSSSVFDNNGNAVGTINKDNTVSWNDGSTSIWHNDNS